MKQPEYLTKREFLEMLESAVPKTPLQELRDVMAMKETQSALLQGNLKEIQRRLETQNIPLSIFNIPS
jgi:hypothetical protein